VEHKNPPFDMGGLGGALLQVCENIFFMMTHNLCVVPGIIASEKRISRSKKVFG
jgi:hypothetical protein